MHRIDHPTADVTDPAKPVYTEGNPSLGVPATFITDDWLNDVQENLMRLLEEANVTPTKGRDLDVHDAIVSIASSVLGLRSKGIYTYSGAQVLTNAVLGGTVRYTGTGGHAFTLPVINTPAGNCPAGTRIEIVNYGTGDLTITRGSSDTFTFNGAGTSTTIATVPPGGNIHLQSDGTSSWNLVLGTLALQYGDHLGKTAAQFNDSQLLSTTAFVQRALGNMRGYIGLTTNTSLTADHAGLAIFVSSSSGARTISLPAASLLPAGSVYKIFNTGVDDVIVTRVGGDTIVVNTTSNTVTSVTLKTGDWIELISLGSGSLWYHGGGTGQLKNSTQFGASLAANGWQRLPSGIIIQWGSFVSSGSADTAVTFPIAFPTALYSITDSSTAVSGQSSTGTVVFGSQSVSGFTAASYNAGTGARNTGTVRWMAIGS